ncbi:MAG TPA: hypothetical protein VMM79_14035, partial [Longimicrobiales bacterium]|nr:hypothetical protein [Longimicrobiales bacterium]
MRSIPTFMILAFVLASPALAQAGPGAPADVRDVFARGFLVEDRNGDDLTDFVRTRIVLPVSPTVDEVAAAANIAARLGYETSALDMGIAARGETAFDVPVVIIGGRTSFGSAAIAGLWGGPLAAGEGAIGFIAPAGPLRAGGVAVDGGDATGLLAAAAYLAGRYPSVWGMRGTALATVPERIGRYLVERGIVLEATTLDRVVVDAMRPGISRALVTVRLADA